MFKDFLSAVWERARTSPWGEWFWSNGPADYILVIVGAATACAAIKTLRAIERQVGANVRAARAASQEARTASLALKLAHRPILDIDEIKADARHSAEAGYTLEIGLRLFNASSTQTTVVDLLKQNRIAYPSSTSPTVKQHPPLKEGLFMAPGKGFAHAFSVGALDADQAAAYNRRRLIVNLQLDVEYTDPFGDLHRQCFKRIVVCGPQGASPGYGFFEDIDQPANGDAGPSPAASEPMPGDDK
jgi:hypothetical protein